VVAQEEVHHHRVNVSLNASPCWCLLRNHDINVCSSCGEIAWDPSVVVSATSIKVYY